MAEAEVSGSTRIGASPEAVYALVSDVTRTGEWSPENVGGRWVGGAAQAAVGAKFVGSNRRGWRHWSTTCTVTAADPGRAFAFDVALAVIPISNWRYDLVADGDSTVVTETWVDLRPGWFSFAAKPVTGISDFRTHHLDNINRTLAGLKAAAESSKHGQPG